MILFLVLPKYGFNQMRAIKKAKQYLSYPEVVDRDETLLSAMSSTDLAERGMPASKERLPEAAETAPPSHEGLRGTGDSRHLELDLGERKNNNNFEERSFERTRKPFYRRSNMNEMACVCSFENSCRLLEGF